MKLTKKIMTTGIACFLGLSSLLAGGLLTNTNQSAHFLRNPARGASMEIDAVYTNPAGLAFLSHDGFQFTLNNQSAFQTRTITTTFAPFAMNGGNATKEFKGEASAFVIPSLYAAFKTGDWVISGGVGVVGGGGSLTFANGLPSFESQIALPIGMLSQAAGIPTTYSLNSSLTGSTMTLGLQLGVTYKISENFSAYAGGRVNFVNNSYEGYLRDVNLSAGSQMTAFFTGAAANARGVAASLQPAIDGGMGGQPMSALGLPAEQMAQMAAALGMPVENFAIVPIQVAQTAFVSAATQADGAVAGIAQLSGTNLELDTKQTGFGITPIIGLNFNWEKLNIGVKYEFRSKIDVTNATKVNTTGVADFDDGVVTPHDIPAFFAIGAQYEIVPCFTVSAGYHHFFDSKARMGGDRQKLIDGGINEFLIGAEWRINSRFLVSTGTQVTRTAVTDAYQTDLSHSLNSASVGIGGAFNVTEKIRINAAYFITIFEDWTVNMPQEGITPAMSNTFARTSNVVGIGVDFRF